MRKAFIEIIDDIASQIVLRRIVERLERHDVEGAIRLLNIDDAAYSPLAEALRQAFNAGGITEVGSFPVLKDPEGHRVVARFDMRNPAAERWLQQHSGDLITRIVEDQKLAIRQSLTEGLMRGDNPRVAAIQIAGRTNRVTGRREGGIIGLTAQQAGYAATARIELLSGDPEQLRNYLARGGRDKRFDKTVLKAIAEGKPIPAETVDRIVGRYSAGLLKLRADTLALNETMSALSASKHEAWRQQIEAGKVRADVVTKVWKHLPQERGRAQHIAMNGQTVGFDAMFRAPDGTTFMYPHDPSAPARHLVGCKCIYEMKVDYVAQLVGRN